MLTIHTVRLPYVGLLIISSLAEILLMWGVSLKNQHQRV